MLLNSLFTKSVEKKLYTVMARAMLERMLSTSWWDELFRTHASTQYESDLLFSQWVEVIARGDAGGSIGPQGHQIVA